MKFEAKMTVRMPRRLKQRINGEARRRMLQPADIAREALAAYLPEPVATPVPQPQPEQVAA